MYKLNKQTLQFLKEERKDQGQIITTEFHITKFTEEIIYRFWEIHQLENLID